MQFVMAVHVYMDELKKREEALRMKKYFEKEIMKRRAQRSNETDEEKRAELDTIIDTLEDDLAEHSEQLRMIVTTINYYERDVVAVERVMA